MTIPMGGQGVPVYRTNADIDVDAKTYYNKAAIAMVADSLKTLDFSFVEHRPYRYDNQNASKPTISHPIHTTRMGSERNESSDEEWQDQYNKLLDQLPNGIGDWIKEQAKLSYFSRDPNFYVFHSILVITAKALATIDQATKPKNADSALFERAEENLLVPYVATKAALSIGHDVVKQVGTMWQEIGRNNPYFDKNQDFLNQTANVMKSLESIIIDLSHHKKGALEELQQLSLQIERLKTESHATDGGKDLRILPDTINTLSMVASSLLVGYGPASLLWMLTLGMPAKEDYSSLQKGTDRLAEALTAGIDVGKKALLRIALQMIIMLSVATTLGIADKGLGYLPMPDKSDENKMNLMALDLTAELLVHSRVLQNIARAIAAQMSEQPKVQALIENGIVLATLILPLMALENRKGFAEPLFETLSNEIGQKIDKVSHELEMRSDSELQTLKIFLQQTEIALEIRDYDGFITAYHSLLHSLNISSDELKKEFEETNQLGLLLMQAIKLSPLESTNQNTTIHAA